MHLIYQAPEIELILFVDDAYCLNFQYLSENM